MPSGGLGICRQPYRFVSFDGSTILESQLLRPIDTDSFSKRPFHTPAIARGAGLSYAAASFGTGVTSIDHVELNKIIDFNESEAWIEVEAGISLGKLYDFLIEKSLFLATQPGHPRISVGGCIAADIHGKNQFIDGTFMNQVLSLKLHHPDHGILELSPTNETALFRLTCGGYGLTGNIISCRLKLKKIPSVMAEVSLLPLANIYELPEMLKRSAKVSDFVLSWHDFTLKGKEFGKGFIQEGRFINSAEHENIAQHKIAALQSLSAETRGNFPIPVFNPISVKLMNIMYGARCPRQGAKFKMTLFDSIFPIQKSKELYFKFFGAPGFHEHQVVVPESGFADYMQGIEAYLKKYPIPITLASAKLFAGKQDLLRFSGNGICFALNFMRSPDSIPFLYYLHNLTIECGGLPNIIKDSRLSKQVVARTYSEYDKFCQLLREFDPKRIFKSELSERLEL